MTQETMILIWLGMLMVPPILFGIWMQIKMMESEGGQEYFDDRTKANIKAGNLRYGNEETHEEIAELNVSADAMKGKYGGEVTDLIGLSIRFLKYYVAYGALIGISGYLVLLS